jgi:imidazolonepropionase-like amidohydrolase
VDPLRAATSTAAELLGLDEPAARGSAANLLAVRDPSPRALAHPEQVYNRGVLLRRG